MIRKFLLYIIIIPGSSVVFAILLYLAISRLITANESRNAALLYAKKTNRGSSIEASGSTNVTCLIEWRRRVLFGLLASDRDGKLVLWSANSLSIAI